jgi:hypothetical protein
MMQHVLMLCAAGGGWERLCWMLWALALQAVTAPRSFCPAADQRPPGQQGAILRRCQAGCHRCFHGPQAVPHGHCAEALQGRARRLLTEGLAAPGHCLAAVHAVLFKVRCCVWTGRCLATTGACCWAMQQHASCGHCTALPSHSMTLPADQHTQRPEPAARHACIITPCQQQ